MMIGQTVWYRISESDANNMNKRRGDMDDFLDHLLELGSLATSLEAYLLNPGFIRHYGRDLTTGDLLPAIVIKPYSMADQSVKAGDDWAKKSFSGFADLQVHLPGNDLLWVPMAQEDKIPVEYVQLAPGSSITVLPAHGKFTCSSPAELIS